jgi:Serine/threonine protein kinase
MIHEGDLPCIVMEYVNGKTLEEFVNDRGTLPENEAINYILQIGEALQIVHKRNILHRDVKPRKYYYSR